MIRKLFLSIKTLGNEWKFHYVNEIFCFANLDVNFSYIVTQNLSFDFRHDDFTLKKCWEQKFNEFFASSRQMWFYHLCDGINYEFNAV